MDNFNVKSLTGFALALPLVFGLPAEKRDFDVFNYINPLIGTDNGGHVFPGATLPFGMAKAVADVDNPDEKQGGFASDDSNITGFSHMHDDGTGGSPSLGNFPIFPQTGCPGDNVTNCHFASNDRATKRLNGSVIAKPGYFAITLNTSINTEMTVTNHTALYRITFPSNSTDASQNTTYSPLILVDLIDLPQSITNGSIAVDPKTGRISGNGTFGPSFGVGTYNLNFCADFSGAQVRQTGTFQNNVPSPGTHNLTKAQAPAGAWTQFQAPSNNQILTRVGVSFISVAQACHNAETEIPDFGFEKVRKSAEDAWRTKLAVVEVDATGVDDNLQTVFWSGIYRSMISPQDYTGENYLWDSDEPYYDSYYCIWDSFRSIHPLLTLLDPVSQTLMVRSLIDIYRHEGKLPDCRMSLCKGYTQGGSNADIVLADSYLKGITVGVDWETAYEALISDAEGEPADWSIEGRGGLRSWKSLGYIPIHDYDPDGTGLMTRSVSRTVEYAYDDFCIAEVAKGLGKFADVAKYLERSNNWAHLYKGDQKSFVAGTTGHEGETVDTGYTGFLQPKNLNGSWAHGLPHPHPRRAAEFAARLAYLHTSGLLYIGDEQAFLPVFQFHYAGRPGLSAKFSHFYIPSQFNDTVSGLAGNDDSGAMGSFTTLAMLGLWPVSGQDVYLITPPYFASVSVVSAQTGKRATVRSVNFDAAYQNIYIQSATLDG
ncbi:putative secreted glycosidase, partial [Lachnellula willkommii]